MARVAPSEIPLFVMFTTSTCTGHLFEKLLEPPVTDAHRDALGLIINGRSHGRLQEASPSPAIPFFLVRGTGHLTAIEELLISLT